MYMILIAFMINSLIIPISHSTSSDINLALGKMVIPSCASKPKGKTVITNGDIGPSRHMNIENVCEQDLVRLNVIIPPTKGIGNVVVYAGDCKQCDDLLDNFLVQLYLAEDHKEIKVPCGQYPGKFLKPGLPMRVNCYLNDLWDDEVVMVGIEPNAYQLNVSKNGSIAEVEVYLKEFLQEKGYYGCYMYFFKSKEFKVVEGGSCKTICYELGDKFMSLMTDGTCMCGSKAPELEMPATWCNLSCTFEIGILCGLYEAFPIYIAQAPNIHPIGCFKFQTKRKGHQIEVITPMKCIIKCADRSIRYAIVKGDECFCEEVMNFEMAEAHLCNNKCAGGDQSCGGQSYGLAYTGCAFDLEQTTCDHLYKCADNNLNEFGICLGSCQTGYQGKYCLSKDIPVPPALPTTISTNVSIEDDDYADGVEKDYEDTTIDDNQVDVGGKTKAIPGSDKITKRKRTTQNDGEGGVGTVHVTAKSHVDRTRIAWKSINIFTLLSLILTRRVVV